MEEYLDLKYGDVSDEDLRRVVAAILERDHLKAVKYTNENTGSSGQIVLEDDL